MSLRMASWVPSARLIWRSVARSVKSGSWLTMRTAIWRARGPIRPTSGSPLSGSVDQGERWAHRQTGRPVRATKPARWTSAAIHRRTLHWEDDQGALDQGPQTLQQGAAEHREKCHAAPHQILKSLAQPLHRGKGSGRVLPKFLETVGCEIAAPFPHAPALAGTRPTQQGVAK